MKILVASLLISSISFCATAQQTPDVIQKRTPGKNEIGVFVEPFSGSTTWHNNGQGQYQNNLGFQYKRWAKPNIAYRIMGAFGNYSQYNFNQFKERIGDTIIEKQSNAYVPMYFAGGGVEVQRHFYKKVTLYAAIELKAGYGTGKYDEFLLKELESQQNGHYPNRYTDVNKINSDNVAAFTIDASPFIGAKLNFKRISLGTEVSVIKMGIESLKFETMPSYSITNFDIGDFRQRFYINWRF